MYQPADQTLSKLPPDYREDLLPVIRKEFVREEKTVVVFDDDPTGTQTCHDVVVLTSWSVALLAAELKKKPSILFILTNSRSFNEEKAKKDDDNGTYDLPLPEPTLDDLFIWLRRKYGHTKQHISQVEG